MQITGAVVYFTHEGIQYQAVLRWDRKGGVIQNPGRTDQWFSLANANADEVINFLKEKGIPTDDIPLPKKEVALTETTPPEPVKIPDNVREMVFLYDTTVKVELFSEDSNKRQQTFRRDYMKATAVLVDYARRDGDAIIVQLYDESDDYKQQFEVPVGAVSVVEDFYE
jgi:hypothetical protein